MYVCTRNSCVHCFEVRIDFSSIGRESAESGAKQSAEPISVFKSLQERSSDRSSTKFSILVYSVADRNANAWLDERLVGWYFNCINITNIVQIQECVYIIDCMYTYTYIQSESGREIVKLWMVVCDNVYEAPLSRTYHLY